MNSNVKSTLSLFFLLIFGFVTCSVLDTHEDRKTTIEILNKQIEKLGKAYNLPILDTYSIFLDKDHNANPAFFQNDGIHLSKYGYETWISNALLPYLNQNNFISIAMIGNSITNDIDIWDFGKNDSIISNWEFLLNIKAFNLGVGGNTSFDVKNRLDNIVSYKADCYFLLIGINDINRGIQIWETINNIEYIINYFSDRKLKIVLQYVMPIC
jgi:lysophospholipase L1-like esterase